MRLVDKFINEYLIILIRVYQSMSACRDENEKILFPQIRINKHFRIRSASKDKILPSQDLSTVKSSRKEKKEGHKRTFSQNQHKKNISIENSVKVRLAREELQKKADNTCNKQVVVYDCVKTEDNSHSEKHTVFSSRVTHNDQNIVNVSKLVKLRDPNQGFNTLRSDQNSKWIQETEKVIKTKNQKELKGKYRCRVNHHVFEHTRKKSNLNKQHQTMNQFWRNVNQSLILADRQSQQVSKDLQDLIQHFVTE